LSFRHLLIITSILEALSLSNPLETFFSEGNYKIPSLQEYIIQQLSQFVFMFWHVNILTSYLLSFTY